MIVRTLRKNCRLWLWRHRNNAARAALCWLVVWGFGCASPSPRTIQHFHRAPAGWRAIEGSAPMNVRHAHLDVSKSVAFVDPLRLGDLRLSADVAFLSGGSRGFAGVFASDGQSHYVLAARPSGEYRVFQGSSPLRAVGGRGWKTAARPTPTGFWRLGIERRRDRLTFFIDGVGVDELTVPSSASGEGRLQVGLLSTGVTSRWKNFVAGGWDDFQPSAHADWGSAADISGMVVEFKNHMTSFRARPSRQRLFRLLASVAEAKGALQGDAEWTQLSTAADKNIKKLRKAAQEIGELRLFERGWAVVVDAAAKEKGAPSAREKMLVGRAQQAEQQQNWGLALALYATAEQVRKDSARQERMASLKKHLKPLRWHFDFDDLTTKSKSLFTKGKSFWPVAREVYGALPWHESRGQAGLEIQVVARSVKDLSVEKKPREVSVRAGGLKRQELERQVSELESQLADDLKDALVHAEIAEQSATVFGPNAQEPMKTYSFEKKRYRLRMLDGEKLRKLYARIERLREQIEKLGGGRTRDFHPVPAERYTYFVMAEVSTKVLVDGMSVVNIERERSRRGVVQWKHGADKRRGIAASAPKKSERLQLDRTIRALALSRFRTVISLQNVLSRVKPAERLTLLVRLARSAPRSDLVDRLQLALKKELQLRGVTLEQVTEQMLAGNE